MGPQSPDPWTVSMHCGEEAHRRPMPPEEAMRRVALGAELVGDLQRRTAGAPVDCEGLPPKHQVTWGLFQYAEALWQCGRHPEATNVLQRLVHFDPSAAQPRLLLAWLFMQQGCLPAAAIVLNRSVEWQPRSADTYSLLAMVQCNLAQPEAASQLLDCFFLRYPEVLYLSEGEPLPPPLILLHLVKGEALKSLAVLQPEVKGRSVEAFEAAARADPHAAHFLGRGLDPGSPHVEAMLRRYSDIWTPPATLLHATESEGEGSSSFHVIGAFRVSFDLAKNPRTLLEAALRGGRAAHDVLEFNPAITEPVIPTLQLTQTQDRPCEAEEKTLDWDGTGNAAPDPTPPLKTPNPASPKRSVISRRLERMRAGRPPRPGKPPPSPPPAEEPPVQTPSPTRPQPRRNALRQALHLHEVGEHSSRGGLSPHPAEEFATLEPRKVIGLRERRQLKQTDHLDTATTASRPSTKRSTSSGHSSPAHKPTMSPKSSTRSGLLSPKCSSPQRSLRTSSSRSQLTSPNRKTRHSPRFSPTARARSPPLVRVQSFRGRLTRTANSTAAP
eukprot:EG_transcript_7403